VPGADIYTTCQAVDQFIEEELRKVYNSKKTKKLERGIAFPCCIGVNHIMGHFSPLKDDSYTINEGDMVKIVCGCHFDGFAANAATTVVAQEAKLAGKKADVIMAAHHAMQAAQRAIQVGSTNTAVTEAIASVCEEYKCNAVEGVLSHKIKKHLIDGNDVIINKECSDQRVEEWEFAPGDIIGLDVYVSSGEGKPKEHEGRTTVFKRELQTVYNLKMKSSRSFFAEMGKRFPTLPFAIRSFNDTTAAKVGVKECLDHDLLLPYPILKEKDGEVVAHFGSTVVVLPRSTGVLAGAIPFDEGKFEPEYSIKNAEVLDAVKKELWKKDNKKKK